MGWGLKANLLCHLLLGLYGPPRSAQSLSAADLKVALVEKRALGVLDTTDDFGDRKAGLFRATPEDADRSELVLPCVITDEILACLQHKIWECPDEIPLVASRLK
jgi:hypothetical protein